jgi:hypothetical protein
MLAAGARDGLAREAEEDEMADGERGGVRGPGAACVRERGV